MLLPYSAASCIWDTQIIRISSSYTKLRQITPGSDIIYRLWAPDRKSTMSNVTLSSNSDSQNFTIPKLHDDRSHWGDCESWVMIAMKAK